jgi:hypothetical protein
MVSSSEPVELWIVQMTKPGKYTPEAVAYEDQPKQVKHREERNVARHRLEKASGKALSGDVGHIRSLKQGGSNAPGNVHVETVKKNRGWRKGESSLKVPTERK